MKASELSVGDWVKTDNVRRRLSAVHKNKVGYHISPSEMIFRPLSVVTPIPLQTLDQDEFWGRNAFILQDDDSYTHFGENFSVNVKGCGTFFYVSVEHTAWYRETEGCSVCHVHELQHALRLFNTNIEIEL